MVLCSMYVHLERYYSFSLRLIFLVAFLLSVASEDTQISFTYFSADDDIMALGDAVHSTANRSYVLNASAGTHSKGSCGELLHGKKVRIQDVATGRAASFSTSFSFQFTTHGLPRDNSYDHGSGIVFVFVRSAYFATMKEFVSERGWPGGCKGYRTDPGVIYNVLGFSVNIATNYNPNLKAPSNNYIRIGKNRKKEYDIVGYTHNLCGNHTHCSYFSNGRIFTAWIDFNSSSHILEVWLANGSYPSVTKPLQPQLLIRDYKMAEALGDDVYLMFWGGSDVQHVEMHELLSWRFFSSGIEFNSSSESNIPSSRTLLHLLTVRTWAGIPIGVLGTVSILLILWFISRIARASRCRRYTMMDYTTGPLVFSYAELRKATENFDERNLLGTGGSGSVYKGSLEVPSGTRFVAVKQINFSESKQAESLFHAEVASLGQVRHRNVVQLQGWCQEKGRLLLVYDYMPNGGLNEWLHKSGSHFHHQVLSLEMRHSILEGVGAALEYLHEDCPRVILHRDIKSSNVLLDADFKPHLGDFGLARLMDHHKLDKTTLAAGTLGYMAPEMFYTGKATKESDVFSFGILLLEVVCGRRPLDMQALETGGDLTLVDKVWRAHEAGSLWSAVDSRLLQTLQSSKLIPRQDVDFAHATKGPRVPPETSRNSVESGVPTISAEEDIDVDAFQKTVVNLLHVGLLCCLPNPKARPSIGRVNGILHQIREMKTGSVVDSIPMPSLPATKPLGLYHSLTSSQTTLSSTSYSASSVSLVHARSSGDSDTLQQALKFGSLRKDD